MRREMNLNKDIDEFEEMKEEMMNSGEAKRIYWANSIIRYMSTDYINKLTYFDMHRLFTLLEECEMMKHMESRHKSSRIFDLLTKPITMEYIKLMKKNKATEINELLRVKNTNERFIGLVSDYNKRYCKDANSKIFNKCPHFKMISWRVVINKEFTRVYYLIKAFHGLKEGDKDFNFDYYECEMEESLENEIVSRARREILGIVTAKSARQFKL